MEKIKDGKLGTTLGQYETIRINFEGKEGHIEVSGNGSFHYDLITVGGTYNLFEYAEQAAMENMNNTRAQSNISASDENAGWHEFSKVERYLDALIRVSATHKVHDEIDEAVKKLKELTYA